MFGSGDKLKFNDDFDDFPLDIENYSTRTNLSSIFGISSEPCLTGQQKSANEKSSSSSKCVSSTKLNSSKQKQKEQKIQKKSSEWNIQIAKVVSTFKLIDQKNVSQGKLGLTVLKNTDGSRKIILYRSKTNVLSTTSINDDTKFYIKNPYLQFRDDLNEFWSVLFDNKNDSTTVLELIKDKIIEDVGEHNQTVTNESSQEEEIKSSEVATDILSRMAKVGQPLPQMATMIPTTVTTAIATDQSDSSDNEFVISTNTSSTSLKPLVPARKPKSSQQQLVAFAQHHSQQTISPMMNTINTVASYSTATAATAGLLPTVQPAGHVDPNFINMLMYENRTQNTEVRMNLTKLETKIEKVLDKIDLIRFGEISETNSECSKKDNREDLMLELEEKLLEYRKENRKLKLKLQELNENIENSKGIKQYQNLIDESKSGNPQESICIDDFVEFKTLLELLEINIEMFSKPELIYKELIHRLDKKFITLQSQLIDEKKKIDQYENDIKKLTSEKEQQTKIFEENLVLQNEIKEMKIIIDHLEKDNEKLNTNKLEITEKLQNLLAENEKLRKDKDLLSFQIKEIEGKSLKKIDLVVKQIMNNLYQRLVNKFCDGKKFTTEQILQICGTTIKEETNNVIKNLDKKQ